MYDYLSIQLEYLIKLLFAGVCGAVIGYERKNHLKEAGIRTHMLVAVGSTLIMIVSKYGFEGYDSDPSRIAAQIVTGIGFLGAGMIFIKKHTINGLTTAAGIWATAGIGMAIGTNLYFAGAITTVFVFFIQVFLHRDFKWLKIASVKSLNIRVYDPSNESLGFIRKKFSENNIEIVDCRASKQENGYIDMELYIKLPPRFEASGLLELFYDNSNIRRIEF